MRRWISLGSTMRAAAAIAAAIAALLAIGVSPAAATTAEPTLLEPEEATAYGALMGVEYKLPEAAAAGTVTLTFVPQVGEPTTLTLAAADSTAGLHRFLLEVHNLAGNAAVEKASKPTLADGEYTVVLSYRNAAEEAPASAEAEEVVVRTATAPPVLSAPAASSLHKSPLTLQYTLPEESSEAGVTVELVPAKGGAATVLRMTAGASGVGSHTVALDLHALGSSEGVEEASASSIPDGEYTVKVSYRDELENPPARAEATGVKVKTATATPTLLRPASGVYSTVPIEYVLPEQAAAGSAKLEFAPAGGGAPSTLTLTASASTAGTHKFTIDPHNPAADSADVASASPAGAIADGVYGVRVSYEDSLQNLPASAEAAGMRIKTATGVPTLTGPQSGHAFYQPFAVGYSLPEAALAGSVELVFEGAHVGAKTIALTNAAAGPHTVEIAPANPGSEPGIASAPAELPADQYHLTVQYQDSLGNPATASAAVSMRITKGPPCPDGSYSASGETPCTLAPAGFAVGEEGATAASECVAGFFAAEEGEALCTPAAPGSYVEGGGATGQRPCPAGSYASASGSTRCTPTPAGTYATGGAAFPTACPVGTTSGVAASSCVAVASGPRFASETAGPGQVATSSGAGAVPVSVKVAAAARAVSLRKTGSQRYAVRCGATATVLVRVSAGVRSGSRRITLAAAVRSLRCSAGKVLEGAASFRLTPAVKALLAKRSASVLLTVRVYGTGAEGSAKLASATLRGMR